MDDFVYVLAVALVLLAGMLLIANVPSWQFETTAPRHYTELAEFYPGSIGYTTSDISRSVDLGSFSVGEETFEPLQAANELDVSRGVLSTKEYTLDVNVPESILSETLYGMISFDIANTNEYGDLVFVWNGLEVFSSRLPVGHNDVRVPKNAVKTSNKLYVKALGPGAMFWASTNYLLRNFKAGVVYGPSKTMSFEIFPEEYDIWKKGRIYLGLDQTNSTGSLAITINGHQIYNSFPERGEWIDFEFSDAPLQVGDNILTFKSANGYFKFDSAWMDIYLTSKNEVKSKSFELDENDYDRLEAKLFRGLVEFNVEGIKDPRPLKIELCHGGCKEIYFQQMNFGWNNVTFDSSYVAPGTNSIKVSSLGSYEISDVRVGLEKI